MAVITSWEDAPKRVQGPAPRKTFEETLSEFDDVPLFMRSLPNEVEKNEALSALQTLAHDGTPDEVAANFKSQGNDYFMGKRYREAADFFTQALDAKPEDKVLKESILNNRAACNLELKNYGRVLADCKAALLLNPSSQKAFYRSARALLLLDKVDEALDCCGRALKNDPGNGPMKVVQQKARERREGKWRGDAEKTERERRDRETKKALSQAFLARGLIVENSPRPPDNPHPPVFDPASLPPSSSASLPLVPAHLNSTSLPEPPTWTAPDPIRTPVAFPVFLLYPQHSQSDFVSEFHEDTRLGDQLDVMFPPESRGSLPWDAKGEYVSSNLVLYATTKGKKIFKAGKKLTLRELMDKAADLGGADPNQRDGMVIKDGCLSIVIVPKGEAEKDWVEAFKKDREKGGDGKLTW